MSQTSSVSLITTLLLVSITGISPNKGGESCASNNVVGNCSCSDSHNVPLVNGGNDHTCKEGQPYTWCLPVGYSKEDDPFRYTYLTNASLPWSYDFKFIIKEVSNVNDKAQSISVSMYFGVSWFEPRLKINESAEDWTEVKVGPIDEVNVSPETLKYLWYPELEIYGLEKFTLHRVLKEMSGVRIIKNQTIHYELRVVITISCQMTFDSYPLDSHSCPFQIGSYYGTMKTVTCSSYYEFDENRQRSLQHFIDILPLGEEHKVVSLPSGKYAACGFSVKLDRMRMQNIIQVYLPSTMFVMVSWVSFLIKPEVVPGRMALLITLFLVLTNIFNGVKASAPVSKRLNAIDLYLVVCIFLVFAALVEYAVILFMHKKMRQPNFPRKLARLDAPTANVVAGNVSPPDERGKKYSVPSSQSPSSNPPSSTGGSNRHQNEIETKFQKTEEGGRVEIKSFEKRQVQISIHPHDQHSTDSLCDNIDSLALWISPVIFISFNVIYWMTYF